MLWNCFYYSSLSGNEMESTDIFAVFSIYNAVLFSMGRLPYAVRCVGEAKVCFKRIKVRDHKMYKLTQRITFINSFVSVFWMYSLHSKWTRLLNFVEVHNLCTKLWCLANYESYGTSNMRLVTHQGFKLISMQRMNKIFKT